MRDVLHPIAAVLAAAIVTTSPLSAQWPPYPTARVPRTAAGQPDFVAPPPRTADGKPDLSGVWENPGWRNLGNGVSGTGGAPGTPPVLPPGPDQFFNIGARIPGGLPFQPGAKDLLNKRRADNAKDNPDAHCLPMGLMQLHTHPMPRKIVQTPGLMLILYEGNGGIRQIFTDGRPLPDNDPQPWWYGYSTGTWNGDTLTVQTSGLRDGGWLDVQGSPSTDALKMTERYRRVNYGSLQIEITIDDAKAYTRPWTITVDQRLMLDTDLIEFVCAENEKSTAHFK